MILYNENDLNIILKKTKKSFVFFIVALSLSVISILSFVLFSVYEMRLLFQILGSIVSVLLTGLTIYLLDRNLFYRRVATEYLNILKEEGVELDVKIVDVQNKITTLSDRSMVYEITYLDGKKTKTIHLSFLFEPELEKDKEYRIISALNYVKGYYEKD